MSINDDKLNVEALTSSEWRSDGTRARCTSCHINFHDLFNRRHHCRLCGDVFCDKCTHRRALIPPSAIVLKHTKQKQPLNPQSDSKQLQNMGLNSSLQNRDEEERMSYAYKRTSSRTQSSSSVEQASNPNNSYDLEHKLHSLKQDKDYQYNLTINQSILEDDLLSLSVASSSAFSYTSESESVISTSMLSPHNQHQYEHQNEPPEQQEQVILYGKGLEQRMKLAREPLRVCLPCHEKLSHLQEELRNCNSNAMRYNAIDPTDHIRRMLNSPLAFTLGHEIRKAAYTLNNLLPLPKRMGSFLPDSAIGGGFDPILKVEQQCCKNNMGMGVGTAGDDGVRIPAYLLERAKGIAILTIFKIGMGIAGFEFGTGLLISRLGSASSTDDIDAENGAYGRTSIGDDNEWSPPCAIGSASACIGAMAGVQISDHVFLCMTDEAVDVMSGDEGSVQLGVDIGVAVGPVGRSAEADLGIGTNMRQQQQQQQQHQQPNAASTKQGKLTMAPIYTYSQSKGLYAGISLDGKVVVIRHEVNQKFYGQPVSSRDLLNGSIPTPLAAQPLYDALKRCHVYASASKPPKNQRAV